MTAEAALSCHAEASAGSPYEVRVVKKETEEAAQFSADRQLTGRSCFFTLLLLSSIPLQKI